MHLADNEPEEVFLQARTEKSSSSGVGQSTEARCRGAIDTCTGEIRRVPTANSNLYARKKLERAVKEGRIAKLPCEICGSIEVEAHHNDYAKWKEVRWFCKEHHIKYHDILRNA